LIAGLGGACGQVENGVFMMAAPVDLNLEFDCDVPAGMWIMFSNAGFFTTQGVDAQTDADLEALAAAGFHTSTDWLTLDGRNIPLKEFATGAYDVTAQSETGAIARRITCTSADRLREEPGGAG
jgi:hypothetical protein